MQAGFKLSDIAAKLGLALGTGLNPDKLITGVNTLEDAGPDELSFLANPKYASFLKQSKAGVVILHPQHAQGIPNALVSENPYLDFARCIGLFAKPEGEFKGISPLASIDANASLGSDCTVYPFVFIGPRAKIGSGCKLFPGCYIGEDVEIGENSVLYPHCTIMAGAKLGSNAIIHAGVVLGSDGFGFVPGAAGIEKIPQIGSVRIGSNVEIGANTAIDRAALGETTVGNGSKLDNLVQIGHNVRIGQSCLLVSQVGIAGSTHVGNGVILAGQAGLSGHLQIGDGVTVGPQAGVSRNIKAGETVSGSPAMPKQEYLRSSVLLPRLPELLNRIRKLETAIEAMADVAHKAVDSE